MKPFHFTLEAVRTVRQRQEQQALEHYARALLARGQALERLTLAQRQLEEAAQEMRVLLTAGCPAYKAAQAQASQRFLEDRRNEFAAALTLAERRVNAALTAMLHARRQREVVDKCFDRQKTRYQREVARGEQKILDELASRRSTSIFSWNPAGAL